jgi:hypothetical protein
VSRRAALTCCFLFAAAAIAQDRIEARHRRIVILKVDGLNGDLLYRNMRQIDPATGKSCLPWLSHIFRENGVVFENFYTRGISLSTPSWSMLDTGRHAVIRGNVEYDRYTGHIYDYLNFFPFYLGYARSREVDMPGVEVLDRAGIPLLIDAFPYGQRFQSFQLFQRGVRWTTLQHVLQRRFSSKVLLSAIESADTPSLDELLGEQTEAELKNALTNPEIHYLDFYSGDLDHEGHATNQAAALFSALRRLDGRAGRIWTAIQSSPLAGQTVFIVVSDHGMNNVPGVFSQGFSLPDLFNSTEGGAHHVITNRHQMSDYKIMGLNPLVQRVVTPSTASFYLAGEAERYPTAWLDVDGNERAAVQLRNSDLNKIHILLLQLAKPDLPMEIRKAAAVCVRETIARHRVAWTRTDMELEEEMSALRQQIEKIHKVVAKQPRKWTAYQHRRGEDKVARRVSGELQEMEREHGEYIRYLDHLRNLLAFEPDTEHPFRRKISDFIPEESLGDNNTVWDLQHYVAGPSSAGLVVDSSGRLDEAGSFRHIDYFSLFAQQRVRNNPQQALSARPIDFTAMRLPDSSYAGGLGIMQRAYWIYADDDNQLLILVDPTGRINVKPIRHLTQNKNGKIRWIEESWRAGLPMHLFEDPNLHVPAGVDRGVWLSGWHSERDWFEAIHACEYSNGIIGVTEELSPVGENVPGTPDMNPVLLRYERRRRELVQADFHVFAADHWNFNVRNFNPGGNHGSFFRISTHSVWMMSGAGIPNRTITTPYDSLNFGSTVLNLAGRNVPLPDRVVELQ